MSDSYLTAQVREIFLPYVLKRVEDGRYVILNRHYKPLGHHASTWVDYAGHAVSIPGLTADTARQLSWKDDDNLAVIHLYNDGCVPTDSKADWAAYQQRLERLAALTVAA